jgi:hypothetical protein
MAFIRLKMEEIEAFQTGGEPLPSFNTLGSKVAWNK